MAKQKYHGLFKIAKYIILKNFCDIEKTFYVRKNFRRQSLRLGHS